ncbi:MFS transporter [Frateuria hangzhouensis]|uniref:MFS transporter n=1 Tax=Frateuria hangzhouensis TaxID=2995589 RepID=UPI0022609F04|nr:MFS transporter [Frateuria sp. STR12]MCX7515283.1 MFS transporter [Frateuria sp. STR12]
MTTPDTTPPPTGRMTLPLAALLALCHCAAFADRNLPAVAAPLLKADLHLTDAQLGLLMGPAFAVLYAVGMLVTLPLGHSPHRFRLLAGCIATWAIGMVCFAMAQTFEGLLAARALVGLGQAAFVPLALAMIVDDAAPHWRARAMAVFTAGSAIGRSLALLLGGLALAWLARWAPAAGLAHWRLMFLVMAAPNLLLMLVLLGYPYQPSPAATQSAGLREILHWLRRRPALAALYLYGAGGAVLVVQTVGAWAPSVLNREQGLAPATAALAFGVALLFASPLGHLTAGALVDTRARRITPAAILAIGLLLVVPPLWATPLAPSATTACLLMAFTSLAGGAAAVAALAGLPAMLPAHLRGAAVRLFLVFITVVGVGLGPFLAGLVSDGLGGGGNGLSTALSLVCVSVALSGTVAAWAARSGWRRAAREAAT